MRRSLGIFALCSLYIVAAPAAPVQAATLTIHATELAFLAAAGGPVFPVGVLEYLLLAAQAQRKGDVTRARAHCLSALAIEPQSNEARAMLAQLPA